ncbi:hypothetical protein QE152_g18033 [Popillia japonica]|uniref:Uncharacterized protein n=1 Tax=Popillia japonica TaxID=7064 RepID=A0AAW1L4I5_POPJA
MEIVRLNYIYDVMRGFNEAWKAQIILNPGPSITERTRNRGQGDDSGVSESSPSLSNHPNTERNRGQGDDSGVSESSPSLSNHPNTERWGDRYGIDGSAADLGLRFPITRRQFIDGSAADLGLRFPITRRQFIVNNELAGAQEHPQSGIGDVHL